MFTASRSLFILLVFSIFPSTAWAPILPNFGEVCARIGKAALSLFIDAELKYQTDPTLTRARRHALWTNEPGFENRLTRATEKRLRESAKDHQDSPLAKEKTLQMKDKTFTVLQVLGKGGDGEVFLVERNGVKSVIKRFTRPVLQENLDVLAALRKEGIETVEVRSVDKDANMVEFAYVEGVAVSSITHYGLDHGFNYDDMAMVRERFDAFKARYPRLRGIDDFNVFLDIKTGKFIVIDPW